MKHKKIGKCILYNADCFKLFKKWIVYGKKFDLIVTDPPYQLDRINTGGSINNKKGLNKSLQQLNTDNLIHGFDIEVFADCVNNLQDSINLFVWCSIKQVYPLLKTFVGKYKCKYTILCWHKSNALPTYANKYLSDTEYCLYLHKGKGMCKPQCYEDAKTWWLNPINHKDKKLYGHPTIKPLYMIEQIVKNCSREGDLVLDCFMGSGTTGVACRKLGRRFVGIEILEEYYKLSKKRIRNKE